MKPSSWSRTRPRRHLPGQACSLRDPGKLLLEPQPYARPCTPSHAPRFPTHPHMLTRRVPCLAGRRSARAYSLELWVFPDDSGQNELRPPIFHLVGLVGMEAVSRTDRFSGRDRACVGSVAMVVREVAIATLFACFSASFCSLSRSPSTPVALGAESVEKTGRDSSSWLPPHARQMLLACLIRTI